MGENELFKVSRVKNMLLFGGGHGIGLALIEKMLEQPLIEKVFTTYRNEEKAKDLFSLQEKYPKILEIHKLDPLDELSLEKYSDQLQEKKIELDLIGNSIGFLDEENIKPEKRLEDIQIESLLRYFSVNSIPTVLIAKYFYKLFSKESVSSYFSLSAKVGSIEDNGMGGWYGYRSSKCAQNMFIKNIALEFRRKKLKIITLAIHPGTTITKLSEPYISHTNLKLHTPLNTAENIIKVLNNRSLDETGCFFSWDGTVIPW